MDFVKLCTGKLFTTVSAFIKYAHFSILAAVFDENFRTLSLNLPTNDSLRTSILNPLPKPYSNAIFTQSENSIRKKSQMQVFENFTFSSYSTLALPDCIYLFDWHRPLSEKRCDIRN